MDRERVRGRDGERVAVTGCNNSRAVASEISSQGREAGPSPGRPSGACLGVVGDAAALRWRCCCSLIRWPSAASASHPSPTACSASPAAWRTHAAPGNTNQNQPGLTQLLQTIGVSVNTCPELLVFKCESLTG